MVRRFLSLIEEFPSTLPPELAALRIERLRSSLMIAFLLRYGYLFPCLFLFPYLFNFHSVAYNIFFSCHIALNTIALVVMVRFQIVSSVLYFPLIITDYVATLFVPVVIRSFSPVITILLITVNTALLGQKKLAVTTLCTFLLCYPLLGFYSFGPHAIPVHFDIDQKFQRANYLLFDILFMCASNFAATFAILLLKIRSERSEYSDFLNKQTIVQEREKSEKLLLNILPEEVAVELKNHGISTPRFHESCSVLFTDFVGFTQIAESLSPQELVLELDRCFSYFDQVARHHNLEKLKTIGDAYMAATGIPNPNPTHAIDIALAALEIRDFMSAMRGIKTDQGLPYWELRIGIHSGSLVAGVVGESKFAYDVWGDTVNLASRMESSGESGQINISRATYEQIKYFFDCEYRGKIKAKRKGEIDMYFLKGLKGSMSVDGDHKTPSPKMLKIYHMIQHGKKVRYRSEKN